MPNCRCTFVPLHGRAADSIQIGAAFEPVEIRVRVDVSGSDLAQAVADHVRRVVAPILKSEVASIAQQIQRSRPIIGLPRVAPPTERDERIYALNQAYLRAEITGAEFDRGLAEEGIPYRNPTAVGSIVRRVEAWQHRLADPEGRPPLPTGTLRHERALRYPIETREGFKGAALVSDRGAVYATNLATPVAFASDFIPIEELVAAKPPARTSWRDLPSLL